MAQRPAGGTTLRGRAWTVVVVCVVALCGAQGVASATSGSGWRIMASPSPPGANGTTEDGLSAVACPAPGRCAAVGVADGSPLIEEHTTRGWVVIRARQPTSASFPRLVAVSCARGVECLALGASGSDTAPGPPWAEQINGRSARLITSPPSADTLNGLSCLASRRPPLVCIAVGNSGNGPIAVRWDGRRWTTLTGPLPRGGGLDGVSCLSLLDCTAVGADDDGTLVEHWNGHRWTVMPSPSEPDSTGSVLESVSCAGQSWCAAVGYYIPTNKDQEAFIEVWNGSNWTLTPAPGAAGALYSLLSGVACASSQSCEAVGEQNNGSTVPMVEQYDGSWVQSPPVPLPSSPDQGVFAAVADGPSGTYFAVGDASIAAGEGTLVEQHPAV